MKRTFRSFYAAVLLAGVTLAFTSATSLAQTYTRVGNTIYVTRRVQNTNGRTTTITNTSQILAQQALLANRAYSYIASSQAQPGVGGGQGQASAQTAGSTSVQKTATGDLIIRWSGDTRSVQRIYIALFDANNKMLDQKVISQLPPQVTFTGADTATHYGVEVDYSNGTSNRTYWPVQ
jgi:hypothetical protein